MKAFSLWKMLQIIGNLILSSPIFIVTLIIGIILLIAMILSLKSHKKITKNITLIIYIFLIIFLIIYYNSYIYNLLDNFMNTVFTQLFFPNLATYSIIIVSSIVILFYSFINKNTPKYLKIINTVCAFIIFFIFFLTLSTIVKNNINIYEELTIYSNQTLLVLIEFNMLFFTLWIIILLSIKIVKKMIRKSNNKVIKEFLKQNESEVETLKL